MTVLITPVDNVIRIESIENVSDKMLNKLHNPDNQNKITACLKDLHLSQEIEDETHRVFKMVDAVYEHDVKTIRANHEAFLKYVDDLPEIQPKIQVEDSEDEEFIKFTSELLKSLENEDDDTAIYICTATSIIAEGIIVTSVEFFKKVLDKVIDDCYGDKK